MNYAEDNLTVIVGAIGVSFSLFPSLICPLMLIGFVYGCYAGCTR